MRLTRNFRLAEFDCRDGTAVPQAAVDDYRRLCQRFLQPLRDRYGPTEVISGFRTPAHNGRVGGARRSMHLWDPSRGGAAADVKCAGGSPHEWARFLEALGPGGLGRYDSSVHVDTRAGRARW